MENKKRVQRKAKQTEIRRLNNILTYCKVDEEDKAFIRKNIKYLEEEIGYIK